MKKFSLLLENIIFSPSTKRKIDLISKYFQTTDIKEKGFALGILAGKYKLSIFGPSKLKILIKKHVDPFLFDLSYDYVGDLAETIALIWPLRKKGDLPSLSEFFIKLKDLPEPESLKYIEECLSISDTTQRWTIIKLLSGGLRIGLSERLTKIALANYSYKPLDRIEKIWHGLETPYKNLFLWLDGKSKEPKIDVHKIFHPLMLSTPININKEKKFIHPKDFLAEWKWDGIRVQLIITDSRTTLFSRNGDNISNSFPELNIKSKNEVVIDGELLVGKNFVPESFNKLQQRLNRKKIPKKYLELYPAFVRAYDILFYNKVDLRSNDCVTRRNYLKEWHNRENPVGIDLSQFISFQSFDELKKIKKKGEEKNGFEGIMLKRKQSQYISGRPAHMWYKWKRDPKQIDAILMYAQRGHGKRSSYYSDFTFGLMDGENIVPIGKAYSGFTNEELKKLDHFVRQNTIKKYGPVREVKKKLVLEISFDDISKSSRHKSGVALRFPRITFIRWDKPVEQVECLENAKKYFKIS